MTELVEVKERLDDLYTGVLVGALDPKVAAVASQVLNTRLRLAEVELKTREQLELEERLEQLEELLEEKDGARRWG